MKNYKKPNVDIIKFRQKDIVMVSDPGIGWQGELTSLWSFTGDKSDSGKLNS